MTKLVIFCEVFLALLVYSEACLCPSQHPQTKFCNSEFVVQAKVFSRQTFNREGNVVYTVKILKDFKNDTRQYSKTQKIYTSASSCGSDFELNEEYIISGTINGQKWKTSKCSWNTKTSFLTKYQNTALNHGIYKNSCSCKAGYFLNEMKLNFNFTDKL
ncbi:metalloproteinase inhibitor 3-like [Ostrea edulis]|uniref:metalloproteinase inhibitor 3-like n=1 Tax=Ostrea edulis TaxID=37623 RepID=UPI0024AEB8D8|nr:metalloproteinase inhibitor 3-like [Ostrea edulis]